MKIIDFKTRKVLREIDPDEQTTTDCRSVPVLTFVKGKFTLALEEHDEKRFVVVYNTATKTELARRRAGAEGREAWIRWAEEIVKAWQRGHAPPEN